MEQEDDLAESKSKTFQLIGRNVLLFQQVEQLLKFILPRSTVSISPKVDAATLRADRYAKVEKATLGNLVNQFIDEVCDLEEPEPPNDPNQVTLHFAFRRTFQNTTDRDVSIQRLRDLVEDRNNLIHQLILQIDLESAESWRKIQGDLETQQSQVRSEIKMLQHLIKTMKGVAAEFARPETQRELICWVHRGQLINHLRAAAKESVEPGGWTLLKVAINRDPLLATEVVTTLKEAHDVPTVTALLETLGGFELRHEKNDKGKTQTFYRLTHTAEPALSRSSPRFQIPTSSS